MKPAAGVLPWRVVRFITIRFCDLPCGYLPYTAVGEKVHRKYHSLEEHSRFASNFYSIFCIEIYFGAVHLDALPSVRKPTASAPQ
jgi:hypothetical protein